MQEARASAVEAKVFRIGLARLIVQASPDIVGGIAVELKLLDAISDDDADEQIILFDETQNHVAELCFANLLQRSIPLFCLFNADCDKWDLLVSSREPLHERTKRFVEADHIIDQHLMDVRPFRLR